jgi:uncharacterized protein (TIGR00730 family)
MKQKRSLIIESCIIIYEAFRVTIQFIYGTYLISRLEGAIISCFGGRGIDKEDWFAQQAYELGKKCAQSDISVITGGGPGIMAAANCGAYEVHQGKKFQTMGIGVQGVDQDFVNPCASIFYVRHFSLRKIFLIRYASAFVIFPGGIGTADELFDTLNLMKLQRIKQVPVILFGVSFWKPLLDWYERSAIEKGVIQPQYKSLIYLTDDINDVFNRVQDACKGFHV